MIPLRTYFIPIIFLCYTFFHQAMEQEPTPKYESEKSRTSSIVIDLDQLHAELGRNPSNSSLGSQAVSTEEHLGTGGAPSRSVNLELESIQELLGTKITAQDFVRTTCGHSDDAKLLNKVVLDLVQKRLNELKLNAPDQYLKLIKFASGSRSIDYSTNEAATRFLIEILSVGIEDYKHELERETAIKESQKTALQRHSKITTGTVVTTCVSSATAIISAIITFYLANKTC